MADTDAPFTTAQQSIADAADWLADLDAGTGAGRSREDDEVSLEQAAAHIEKAISVLEAAGLEQVEVAVEIHDGYAVPIVEGQVVDADAAQAARSVREYTRGLLAWSGGGDKVDVTEGFVAGLVTILATGFASRLQAEHEMNEAWADAADVC